MSYQFVINQDKVAIMDPRENPYSPGAGTPPPELTGRDGLIEEAAIALSRLRNARAARGLIMYGLRGVGKTVLLNRIRLDAEADGIACIPIEAPEGRSLPAILLPTLRSCLIRMSRGKSAARAFRKAMATVAAFAQVFKMKYEDVEVSIDLEPAIGVADSGDLENDLADLVEVLGQTAKKKKTAMAMFIDELQFVEEDQLAALITAFHRASQAQLPITMLAAGLPQLLGQMGKAKSYAERLFEFMPLGPLNPTDGKEAIVVPAKKQGVEYESAAVAHIIDATKGYPYFLQEWGQHSWRIAQRSPISRRDTIAARTRSPGRTARRGVACGDIRMSSVCPRVLYDRRDAIRYRQRRCATVPTVGWRN